MDFTVSQGLCLLCYVTPICCMGLEFVYPLIYPKFQPHVGTYSSPMKPHEVATWWLRISMYQFFCSIPGPRILRNKQPPIENPYQMFRNEYRKYSNILKIRLDYNVYTQMIHSTHGFFSLKRTGLARFFQKLELHISSYKAYGFPKCLGEDLSLDT